MDLPPAIQVGDAGTKNTVLMIDCSSGSSTRSLTKGFDERLESILPSILPLRWTTVVDSQSPTRRIYADGRFSFGNFLYTPRGPLTLLFHKRPYEQFTPKK
jgi:hypothetical protein